MSEQQEKSLYDIAKLAVFTEEGKLRERVLIESALISADMLQLQVQRPVWIIRDYFWITTYSILIGKKEVNDWGLSNVLRVYLMKRCDEEKV